MENVMKWGSFTVVLLSTIAVVLLFTPVLCSETTPVRKVLQDIEKRELRMSTGVKLNTGVHRHVVMDNGLVQVTLSNPEGEVTGIKYKGIDNVLESRNDEDNRGYWDVVWYEPNKRDIFDKIKTTDFKVISQDSNQVELSFTKKWDIALRGSNVPLNVDKRYILRRGSSGFYMYTILEREEGWPDVDMDQIRAVFKLQKDKFHYMAISDDRQRIMPMPEDRNSGERLAYPEAVLLTNPTNPNLRGEVDDKYQYSVENKDDRVHGWISFDPPVGFWMITPSDEFRSGGPIKQDLTCHVGPVVLSMFTSTHYGGKDVNTQYRNGEPWKKVMGPVFVYLNAASSHENPRSLWEDAKEQSAKEVKNWPYNFPQSEDFPKANQRGSVSGQLLIRDRYLNERYMWGSFAYVGLAAPGEVGSWQTETKGYQFWTQADDKGNFLIENVREGDYNLYAWVPQIIGDYKHPRNIAVKAGSKIRFGTIVFHPPRNGPTLWEIGIPDRTAAEFFIPDPYPTLMNTLYVNYSTHRFRQYGLWERYADIYRIRDLEYTLGLSDYTRDWFFAQVTRSTGNRTYESTTWKVIFGMPKAIRQGNYTLRLALASATQSEIQVRFNDLKKKTPHFTTGLIGKDNAIARHGIHGLYWLFSIDVPCYRLHRGQNIIYLTQSRSKGAFQGVMYDYIRLEGPART